MALARRSSLAALALTALAIAGAFFTVRRRGSAPEEPLSRARAVVDGADYDLGDLDSPDEFRHTFVIRNEGDAPLRLSRGPSNCSCTLANLPEKPVPPGGSVEVAVAFQLALKSGRISRQVTLITNDPDHEELHLKVFCTLRDPFGAHPAPLSLFFPFSQRPPAETHVYSQVWSGFRLTVARKSLEGMKCRIEPATNESLQRLEARSGYRVEITMPPEMADGRFTEWVEFSALPAGAGQMPRSLRLEIQGNIYGRLTIHGQSVHSDQTLRLGTLGAEEAVREILIMKVHDERRSLAVRSIETEPGFLRARVTALENAAKTGLYRIEVEIPRGSPAMNCLDERAGTVRLRTDHPRLPLIELKVEFAVLNSRQGLLTQRAHP